MPVQSFLAFSQPQQFESMLLKLQAIEGAEVFPADNREVAILVWDSDLAAPGQKGPVEPDSIEEMQCLAMVFGHSSIADQD